MTVPPVTVPAITESNEPATIVVIARLDAAAKGAGVSVRIAGIVESLARANRVTLVLLRSASSTIDSSPAVELCDRLGIERIEWEVERSRVHLLQSLREWHRITRSGWNPAVRIAELVAAADQVWVCQMHPLLDLGIPHHRGLVVDIDTAVERLWVGPPPKRALGVRLGRRTIRRLREKLGRVSATVLLAAVEDARLVGRSVAPAPVVILANTAPAPSAPEATHMDERSRERVPHVLMVGDMAYDPNFGGAEWLIREVWPLVESQRPDARLRLIGRNAERLTIRFPELSPTVAIRSNVPDLSTELLTASVSVAPMPKVAGTPIKVLESFAWQLPVVATTPVFDAFGGEATDCLLVADDPAGFAAAIVRLLDNDELAHQLASAGLGLFRRGHSTARFNESIDALIEYVHDNDAEVEDDGHRRSRLEQRGVRVFPSVD